MQKTYQILRYEQPHGEDLLALRVEDTVIPIKDYKVSGYTIGNVELQVTILATSDEVRIEPRQAVT